MRWRSWKKASAFGFMATAAVLAMASVAFACTAYRGKLIVSATDPVRGTSTAFADGSGALHGFCPVPTQVDNSTGGVSEVVMPAQAMYRVANFTLTVGPSTTCASPTTAPNGDYDVRWLNLTDNNLLTDLGAFCQNTSLPSQDRGDMTVTSGTAGPTAFAQGTASVGDRVNVCLDPKPTNTIDESPPEVRLWMI